MKMIYVLLFQLVMMLSGFIRGKAETFPLMFSMILSLLFLYSAYVYWKREKSVYAKHVFVAMGFALGGDIVLAGLVPGGIIVGMLLFGTTHVLLIKGMIGTIRERNGVVKNRLMYLGGTVCGLYFVAVWMMTSLRGGGDPVFVIGSLVYGLLISAMATIALSLYTVDRQYLWTAIGAVMFVVSDSIISIDQTYDFRLSELLVKLTYYVALFGIIHAGRGSELMSQLKGK